MKLKLKALRKSTMKSLVVQAPGGAVYHFEKLGHELEIEDSHAHKILSDMGDMLEAVQPQAVHVKMTHSPEDRSAKADKEYSVKSNLKAKIKEEKRED